MGIDFQNVTIKILRHTQLHPQTVSLRIGCRQELQIETSEYPSLGIVTVSSQNVESQTVSPHVSLLFVSSNPHRADRTTDFLITNLRLQKGHSDPTRSSLRSIFFKISNRSASRLAFLATASELAFAIRASRFFSSTSSFLFSAANRFERSFA
jgi:hypothetical protein